jgi:murein DD-endopeptidase MepM/ murein hydrolase activator NlpD
LRARAPGAKSVGRVQFGAQNEPPPSGPPRAFLGGVPPILILAAASGVMAILLLAQVTPRGSYAASGVGTAANLVRDPGGVDAGDSGATDAEVDAAEAPPPAPPAWRVSSLAKEPGIELLDGTMGKRPLLAALAASSVEKSEALRLVHSFDGVRSFEDCGQKDTFLVAREKTSGKIVAFEYMATPFDVWQARTNDESGALEAKKLELRVEKKHVAVGIAVGSDLRASIAQAGLDDDLLPMLDDALEGHAELADLRSGARLRVLAVEDEVGGVFVQYSALEAVEYIPASGDAKPLRVYYFGKAPTTTWLARSAKQRDSAKAATFFYDAKGRQPMHGGWKSPVPFARIASRFNPKRMHPVLHVIMPHNGVDFAAPPGTPVYVTAEGTVKSAGNGGPCGNMVQVTHSNGFTSAYCHLSRFAAGLHAGQHLEARQLVGYVGATGRTTGPHLHFAVKRGDNFIDPLALKLDGVRVVPLADRAEFERERAELDLALDAIPLPPALPAADAGAVVEVDAGSDEVFEETP